MAATYNLISSTTLSSATASVTFSAIPATYNDLVLLISARSAYTSNAYPNQLQIAINGNTSSIYSFREGYAQDGISGGNGSTAQTGVWVTGANSNHASSTANAFGVTEIYIPAYLANQDRPILGYGVTENNSVNFATIDYVSNLYRNGTAITSLVITEYLGSNFLANSTFSLYGIKNS